MDALSRTQGSKTRLVRIVLGADLRHWSIATQAHRHGFARGRLDAQFARTARFGAIHTFAFLRDQGLERRPETPQQWHPLFFAAAYGVKLVFKFGGEIVIDVLSEMPGKKF